MIRFTVIWAIWVILPLSSLAQGTFRVHFDQTSYTVTPNGTLAVGVVIDPVPLSGLFSYGIKVIVDDALARVEAASAISVPPPLDFNGVLGSGADRVIGNGFAAVKGTVDFLLAPGQSYSGSLLATFNLRNVGEAAGQSYSLGLEIYRTLGPTESVFVSGTGETLDGRISLGSATVHVVPEPSALMLMFMGLAGWSGKAHLVLSGLTSPVALRSTNRIRH